MSLPHPLPEDLAELIARRFRALSEPMRVRILDLLRDRELSVNELAEQLSASQQNVSKHLVLLVDAGMLARRKDGTRVYYRRRIRLRALRAGLRLIAGTALRPRRTRRHNQTLSGPVPRFLTWDTVGCPAASSRPHERA